MLPCIEIDRPCLAALAALLLFAALPAAAGDRIYVSDSDGAAIHLSDRSDGHGSRLLIDAASRDVPAAAVSAPVSRSGTGRADVAAVVHAAALAHALDPDLLHAVIATESGYAPRAVSRRGALGLMQLMPATARSYGVRDSFDVQQNVHAGSLHLRNLLDQFGQNTVLALAAYNAGAAAVARHGHQVPPFAETTAYVQRVLRHYAALRRHITTQQSSPSS